MYIIYQITNTINAKVYFGITKTSLAKRWSAHKSEARRTPKTKFHRAIRKYGEGCWTVQELTQCDGAACASYIEDALIMSYDTINNGYNSCPGGYQSTKMSGYKHTTEARSKIVANANNRKVPVYQFDEHGMFVQMWDSSVDAAIGVYNDRCACSNISKCAKRYKGQTYIRKSGYPPYSFGYTAEPPVAATEANHNRIHNGLHKRSKTVYQFDDRGTCINTWSSTVEAGKHFGISNTSVGKAARESSSTHGLIFSYTPTVLPQIVQ